MIIASTYAILYVTSSHQAQHHEQKQLGQSMSKHDLLVWFEISELGHIRQYKSSEVE